MLLGFQDKIPLDSYIVQNHSINWGKKNSIKLLDMIYKDASFVLDRKYKLYLRWKKRRRG